MNGLRTIKRALLSVSDKAGLVELARTLDGYGVELISTGGTARALREAGLPVKDVAEVTGSPEMMDGRVKTLHPRIHGGLLGLRDNDEHLAAMAEHGIAPIDMVVVNLYPFEQTVADASVTLETAIENIDIGGPAMIRSAAKNWRDVAVITLPELYDRIIAELEQYEGALSVETRAQLAQIAFTRTAAYDAAIFIYLNATLSDTYLLDDELTQAADSLSYDLENTLAQLDLDEDDDDWDDEEHTQVHEIVRTNGHLLESIADDDDEDEEIDDEDDDEVQDYDLIQLAKISDLRYGENPHQKAALYEEMGVMLHEGLAQGVLLNGKPMSYNNYVDADAAWQLVCEFDTPACAIIKHTNPAGVALGTTALEAYRKALATDPVSAFGGIVAFNLPLDEAAARAVGEIFTEVIIAPEFTDEALAVLRKKKNLRLLQCALLPVNDYWQYRQISGGFLVQTPDVHELTDDDKKVVSRRPPTEAEMRALEFAWIVCKHTKSNAIVLAREGQTLGVGAGQMNRVDSVRIAVTRAQRMELPLEGAVLASDAFFPFRDGLDEAAQAGVAAVIQPGGSVRDAEVIAAADEHGQAMIFTGVRHFRH